MGFQPVAASFIEQVEGVFERGNQALQFRFEKDHIGLEFQGEADGLGFACVNGQGDNWK